MLDHLIFALSAALAQVLTNLDNLAALIALMLVSGAARSVAGFLLAQMVVLLAALAVAYGVSDTVPHWAGYLGVFPIGLGIWGVWRQFTSRPDAPSSVLPVGASVLVTTLLFLSLSVDSFIVMAPLLADSVPSYRLAGLIGAMLAVCALAALALAGARATSAAERIARRMEKIVPYVMICAGIYILSNSWTDMAQ
ncbi:hypothetical protein M3P21_00205 [Ruegeria sp. 2012CJ41-6]|uniref:Cadmium transporter n=1 Tax=Ruegeria spongiae TaxID=2942209 RepID=A0ABT0PWJ0_9RHOB|nr:hypothetical protein [Ruegeria spongiae]MCL6281941.1 hypothetical protein [Ruegeria spongiae]